MKKSFSLALLPLLALPLLAHASCEDTKAEIAKKIEANGVSHYSLDVVDADKADSSSGKVVGNCESDSKKIIYTRGGGDDSAAPAASAPAPASSAG
ncbi:DUF1161 domain-containing protein [Frateuria aurantia]